MRRGCFENHATSHAMIVMKMVQYEAWLAGKTK